MKNKQVRKNEFGCPIGIAFNQTNLAERCKILKAGIEGKAWKGAKLARAEYHLEYYSYQLRRLKGKTRKTNRRAA